MRTRKLSRNAAVAAVLGAVGAALLVWLVVIPATQVQAVVTYTVNSNDDANDGSCDSTHCSLREAILAANAGDVIAISTAGPIGLANPLPPITDNGLVITGSGQQVNMPLPGIAFTVNADGVRISNLVIDGANVATTGITALAGKNNLVLEGLTVRGFLGDGINLQGGTGDVVQDSVITGNANGLNVSNEDGLIIQGNTFSGNSNAQILISAMGATQQMSIIQNSITAGSDGIVIAAGVASPDVHIGLSVDNRNVFRGTIAPPAQYLRNLSAAHVNAIYNDWNAYTNVAIEAVICDDLDPAPCGPGHVDFSPFITTPSPLATVTPTPTVTATPGTPTVTPTGTPVATATPGTTQALPLVAGCNPLAWTGSDNTPIATIAAAVSPSGILVALWESQAGVWLGYSPQFPEVSDLQDMNRLDVVDVCVNGVGNFSRPVI